MTRPRIALVGDFNPDIVAHRAIPLALQRAAAKTGVALAWDWIGTGSIDAAASRLSGFDAVWCTPGSPYGHTDGALAAIRWAREGGRPFLGTCGGFQHALIEFARDAVGVAGAEHAETAPSADHLVVTRLARPLVGEHGEISFAPGSQLHAIFGGQPTREGYHCNYGPNPAYRARFEAAGLSFSGFDAAGQIRAMELPGHPFFVGTLFQPERAALAGRDHPLVECFVQARARKV